MGTLQNIQGKYIGSFIQGGETLASISPTDSLLVECYVSPKDIGLLHPKMPVNFQIDAFNYNQWGMASGKVMEIADDFMMMNNQPVFKVKCQVNDKALSLKNGYHGKLKKGMTLHAQFLVTQRSLYQLLYDKIDNWVNPKVF